MVFVYLGDINLVAFDVEALHVAVTMAVTATKILQGTLCKVLRLHDTAVVTVYIHATWTICQKKTLIHLRE